MTLTYQHPRELLAVPCYVSGCRQPADRSAIHQARGRVRTCESHDPNRHGYGLPFARVQVAGLAALLSTPPSQERPDIGPQPPVRPIEPEPMPTPPAGARVVAFAF